MKIRDWYMDFSRKLTVTWEKNDSLLCIGLDPELDKLHSSLVSKENPLFEFNKAIIDATAELVCAFKPNSAYYESNGAEGVKQLKLTCDYLKEHYPDIPIILDFKRGDIDNTNKNYAKYAFEYLGVDAITIQPYLGRNAAQVFLDYSDKGIIVLCKTSNPGSGEFQDKDVDGKKLYIRVAENVAKDWNTNNNCHLVVGATYPKELSEVRQIIGDSMIMLVPGLGAQGGDTEAAVRAGINSAGTGLIINSSRSILYASQDDDYIEAAKSAALKMRDSINTYRK
ncbi:MAG: orotidine-5'-phosphate decarboxylase [Candidatus Saccharimonadales bacterium]